MDKVVLLLVSGLARSAIDEAVAKLGLAGETAASAIAEAQTRIQIAAIWNREEQLGTALVRLNDCYRRSLAVQDAKTALAVQKELNRLLGLYRPPAEPPKEAMNDRPPPDSAVSAEIARARAHLAPLELGDEKTPLAELCRLAVLRIIEDASEKRTVSPTPRADGRSSKRAGSPRPRDRSDPAD